MAPNCLGLTPNSASYQLCDPESPDQNFFQNTASVSVFCPHMGAGRGKEAVLPLAAPERKTKARELFAAKVRCIALQYCDRTNEFMSH